MRKASRRRGRASCRSVTGNGAEAAGSDGFDGIAIIAGEGLLDDDIIGRKRLDW